jgi:hypothetical protein
MHRLVAEQSIALLHWFRRLRILGLARTRRAGQRDRAMTVSCLIADDQASH